MEGLPGIVGGLITMFAVVLAILWVLVPLAVFGCYRELKAMRQYQRTMLIDHMTEQKAQVKAQPEGRQSIAV